MPRRVTAAQASQRATRVAGVPGAPLMVGWRTVRLAWQTRATITTQSAARFEEIGDRFVTRLTAEGIGDWGQVDATACQAFVTAATRSGAPPRAPTQHLRR